MIPLEARNATLSDLAGILTQQQAAKVDIVTPLVNVRAENGQVRIAGTSVFDEAGSLYRPTAIADSHLADKLGIPGPYLRKLREQRPDLYDANVNGWVHGPNADWPWTTTNGPDPRTVTLRTFSGDPGEPGVLRAMLSDRAFLIDNFDVLTAALEGVREADAQVTVTACNLTETRMSIAIDAPSIAGAFPKFLEGYHNPFGGGSNHYGNLGDPVPGHPGAVVGQIISAGLVISNGETGGSKFNISPRFSVWACKNGMVITKDAISRVHLGSKLEEGTIDWSSETQRKALELISLQTRDAVATFLTPGYLHQVINDMTAKAATPITDIPKTIEVVTKQLGFSDEVRAGVLDHFIRGGQVTAGGVMQAFTSFAQVVDNPDLAWDMEQVAVKAMELAAA